MKKLLFWGIMLTLVFSFTACETNPSDPEPTVTPSPTETPKSTEAPTPTQALEPTETPKPTDPPAQNDTETPDNGSVLDGSLESILEKIYETADCSENFKEYAKTGLQTTEVTEERSAYYLGKEGLDFEEALASEPIMMPSAYELTLVRVKEDADIEAIKEEIQDNVDPLKWVCVGVDPENVIVDNIDNVIIIIMSNDECDALHDAFLALEG